METHGVWRIIPSMPVTEMIGQSGFDFQILDCEHGTYDFQTLMQDVTVCHAQNCLAYVRVSGLNKVEVQRCLDLGADGVVFPQLNGFEDFKMATKMVQYGPSGIRGFNPFVAAGSYGFNKTHEKKIDCIAIIETLHAIKELDKILKLDKLSMIYIGAYDLSTVLGCIGIMDSPKLIEVIEGIITKCVNASKPVSIMVNSPEMYKNYKEKVVVSFVHTVDSFVVKQSFVNILDALKN